MGLTLSRCSFPPILRSLAFWTYTPGFNAAIGKFFVFFSTALRVLIAMANCFELKLGLAFTRAAVVMIITTSFARWFFVRRVNAGSLMRGLARLILVAEILSIGKVLGTLSFATLVMPMWVMATGIVYTVSVTSNGALEKLGDVARSAAALHF